MADAKEVAANHPEESRPLNDEEKAAVEKLRGRLTAEELKSTPEVRLIMFVRGYWGEKDRDEYTYNKLKETLAWREEIKADWILNNEVPKEKTYLEIWPYDYHTDGDKRGHVIYYERTAFANPPSRLLTDLTDRELIQCHVQMQEVLLWLKAKKSKEIGVLTYKSIVIMDMQDFGFSHLSSSFYNSIKSILGIDQYYYPETLYKLFIINAPFSFRTLWAVVRPWLHPLTQARINLCGGQSDFLPKLKEIIDVEHIPRYLGGECACGCKEGSIGDQLERLYERNIKWRTERVEAEQAEKKATAETT